jgi:hypothetical protein
LSRRSLDLRRPRAGEWLALAAGILLGASLFLPWFGRGRSGWEALAALDVVLVATALTAVALWILSVTQRAAALPVAFAASAALLGVVALAWVGVRLLLPPEDAADRGPGGFVALVAAAGVGAGGALSMREDPAPRGAEARRLAEEELARVEVLPPPPAGGDGAPGA